MSSKTRLEKHITTLDSTLRDGAQGALISFSLQDKLHITEALDEIGVDYIEAGNPFSNPKDMEFFQNAKKLKLKNARLAAFGSTRRKHIKCTDDKALLSFLEAGTQTVVFFGKSSVFQVKEVLQAGLNENLDMIAETAEFFRKNGLEIIFDAEHFFDAYKEDAQYAVKTLKAAAEGGASVLTLCDTRGASMCDEVSEITKKVCSIFSASNNVSNTVSNNASSIAHNIQIGIHAHNDCALAVALSLASLTAGASHVQGTFLGFGERAGNANLSSIIANLELKMGYPVLPPRKITALTSTAKRIAEITNIPLDAAMPFVGQDAFTHKAGMHIDAVIKNPSSYEHIAPEAVGNERTFLMSEVAGRSTIIEKIKKIAPNVTKDSKEVKLISAAVKNMEHSGYQFDNAEGSFELLVKKMLKLHQPFFKLHYYKVHGENPTLERNAHDEMLCSFAQLKIEVAGAIEITAGEGAGPVHALDTALRKALVRFYPQIETMRLIDYKVRVIDSRSATAAKVRVLIESTDGERTWTTVGLSRDIMEASWIALVDSVEYMLAM
ncbi:MAG: citramalate synthase [Treponemataceae bacterium]|nr:MAG: citramalate synthase [Treponemataceae bacterium]